jgi:hypothetical protein
MPDIRCRARPGRIKRARRSRHLPAEVDPDATGRCRVAHHADSPFAMIVRLGVALDVPRTQDILDLAP